MALVTTSFVVVFSLQGRVGRAPPLFFIFSFLFFWGIIGGEIIKGFKGKKKRGGRKGGFSSLFSACLSLLCAVMLSFPQEMFTFSTRMQTLRGSLSCCGLISSARHSLLPL
jgi:hypothetical protein